jgi:hypothetical protein
MTISNTEAEISFRFLCLDKFQAYSLTHEISGSSHEKHPINETYVASVPLTAQTFEEINDYYIRQRIELGACDIFVSVNSTSDTGIVDVPVIVNRMLKYIDCKLTFSFVVG